MNLIDLVWLGGGLGIGFLVGKWARLDSSATRVRARIPPDRSQQLELAYRSTLELSQFKAGFLARTSHELRSPLNGMIGAQQLVLEELCESPEEEREFIAQANESALKLVKLLDEVINVAKIEYGSGKLTLEAVSIADTFSEVYTRTHLLAENRNLKFHLALPEPDFEVLADRRSLEQVLTSLVSSAIGTMQEGQLSLTARADAEFGTIELEDERPIDTWREALNLLKTEAPPDLEPPSIGFSLILNQTLMQLMNGQLELVKTPHTVDAITRLRCVLPRTTARS